MRVYLPGAITELEHYLSGSWEPTHGYAVTPRLIDISAADDEELLAEQARDSAAADSVLDFASPRRLVIVVDYPRADVTPDPGDHPAAVTVTGRVMPDTIACAFVDEPEASDDAELAAEGDADAMARLEQHDLLWFDASELAHLQP